MVLCALARRMVLLCAVLLAAAAPAVAVTVTVSPRTVVLSLTGSQQFSAAVDGAGTTTAVAWSVEEADGGTVSPAGLYAPPSGFGTFHLRATSVEDPTAYDTATIDVAPIGVAITPVSASLATGTSQLFTASVSVPSGVSNDVIWSVVGACSENSGGGPTKVTVLTAGTAAGTCELTATSVADPSVQATVTIAIRSLVLSPQAATVSLTGSVQFQVAVPGGVTPSVLWSVDEADGGTLNGSGLYTPPAHAGLFHVRATSVESTANYGEASVDVEPMAASVSPSSVDLAAGASQLFTSTVTAPSGVDTKVVWSLSGGGQQSSGSTPSQLTVFTAPATAGTSTLVATSVVDASVQAAATIHVRSLVVSPKTATVAPTGSVQFAASDGGGAVAVAWTVEETGGGSISGSGLYTPPATLGTYHVRAARLDDPTNYDRATVTVQAISVTISPLSALVLTDGSQLFTATVSAPVGVTRNVTWSLTGVGVVSSSGPSKQTVYTAPGVPGSATLVAASVADPSVTSQSAITVSEVSVAVSPSAAALLASGVRTFTATVSGAATSSVTWRVVEGSAVGGHLSAVTATSVVYTAPAAFGTYHLEATSTADSRKKAVVAIDVGSILSVAVTPGAASLPALGSQVFSATVEGAGSFTNAVGWTASGGTIDPATGAYTAPATAGTQTVRATSVQDPAKFAVATVDVHTVTGLSVAPSTATLNTGEARDFTATVAGSGNFDPSVTWTTTAGVIQGTGTTITYTAPGRSGSATLTARSVADPAQVFAVAITVANRPPVLSVPASQTVAAGQALDFTVSATDPDQDALTVTASGLPSGATFNTATRTFHWVPGPAQLGSSTVTFAAADDGSPVLTDTKAVGIQVTAPLTVAVLAAVPNPSTYGGVVTLTATVTSTGGTPTGTVSFMDGATFLGSGTLNAAGVATFSTSVLSVASHSLTALYAGGGSFAGSTSVPLTETVNPATALLETFDGGLVVDRYSTFTPSSLYAVGTTGPTLRLSKPSGNIAPLNSLKSWGVDSKFTFSGDFTVTVDFKLNNFPFQSGSGYNGSGLRVWTANALFQLDRVATNRPFVQATSSVAGLLATPELLAPTSAGQFRLERQGTTLRGYYRGSTSQPFTLIAADTNSNYGGLTQVGLFAFQATLDSTKPVSSTALDVEYDNLNIVAQAIQ